MLWRSRRSRRRQRGQAAAFTIVALGVVLLSLNFLYKAGKLTTEKMQLQNAADATAYSISLLEARDLNFAAYTNRAMVANEVAIGQLVGLTSFAFHWTSFGPYLRAWDKYTLAIPTLGSSTSVIESMTQAMFDAPGQVASAIIQPIARFGSTVLHYINKVYGFSQQGFHWSTILYAIGAASQVPGDNAPGAIISPLGYLSLVGHAITYGGVPGQPGSFVKTYLPGSTSGDHPEGMMRFAATVNASGDEFVAKRGWDASLCDINLGIGCSNPPPADPAGEVWSPDPIEFELPVPGLGDLFGFEFSFGMSIYFDTGIERIGGSELRYVTTSTAGASPAGNRYSWSSGDATGFFVELEMSAWASVTVTILGIDFSLGVDIDVGLGNNSLTMTATLDLGLFGEHDFSLMPPPFIDLDALLPASIKNLIPIPAEGIPFITSAPFASATAQASKVTNLLLPTDMTNAPADSYNSAPSSQAIAWKAIPPLFAPGVPIPPGDVWTIPGTVPTVVSTISLKRPAYLTGARVVSDKYGGLPMYMDTAGCEPSPAATGPNYTRCPGLLDPDVLSSPWSFQAPYLLIGLVKSMSDITPTAANDPQMGGRFALQDKAAGDMIASVAKSELYFRRPTDYAIFNRMENLLNPGDPVVEEFGSAFNPYWQARLVDTTFADRAVSLLLQQGQQVTNWSDVLTLPGWMSDPIEDWLP